MKPATDTTTQTGHPLSRTSDLAICCARFRCSRLLSRHRHYDERRKDGSQHPPDRDEPPGPDRMAIDRFGVRPAPSTPPRESFRSCRESCSPRQRRTAPRCGAYSAEEPLSAPLRGSRGEIALVTMALLFPIPLLAASALLLPLPDAVARGVASLSPSAEGDKQVSPGERAARVAPGRIRTTGRRRAVEALTASSVGRSTSSQGAIPIRIESRARSAGAVGAQDRPARTRGGFEGADSPAVGNAPTSDSAPPSSPSTPGASEPRSGTASTDQGAPSLLRATGDDQSTPAGASADESGNDVVSQLAGSESGEPGIDAGVSPDELPPVTARVSLPNTGLALP